MIRCARKLSSHRLGPNEVAWARQQRLAEIQMFVFLRKLLLSICSLLLLSFFIHATTNVHSFQQVRHLRSYLTDRTDPGMNFDRVIFV